MDEHVRRREKLRKVISSRWLVVAAGIWVQCAGGAPYDFSVYSQSMKANLHYTQEELDTVSLFKDIGANVGVIAGLLYDYSTPSITLSVAALESFLGYFFIWLSISNRIPPPPLWHMCFYMLVAANTQTFMNTAVVVTCVKIFPTNRGTVIGLMKGFLGLSGAILMQLYHAIYGNHQISFVLLLSWLIPVVCIVFMFAIQPLPDFEDRHERLWFGRLSIMAILLAAYLFTMVIIRSFISLGQMWSIAICMGIFLILLFPLWVVVAELRTEKSTTALNQALLEEGNEKPLCSNCLEDAETTSIDPGMMLNQEIQYAQAVECPVEMPRAHDLHLLQAMRKINFWLLFYTTACGMGSGITTINNMSQLGSSLHYTQRNINTLVSLWSIWNFLGRLGGGLVSEHYLHHKGVPRPVFLGIALFAMGTGHFIIMATFPDALYFGTALVGICYGAQWSLMPASASEIFGLNHFGTLFNTLTIASPLASYILSVRIAGYLYDREAEKDLQPRNTLPGLQIHNLTCYGPHCFRLTFMTMSAVCFSGSAAALWLYFRTRAFYKREIYQNVRHS